MRTINLRSRDHTDLRLIAGAATYYLRVFSDGTFDIYGRPRPGNYVALGNVNLGGIETKRATEIQARMLRFLDDHREVSPYDGR